MSPSDSSLDDLLAEHLAQLRMIEVTVAASDRAAELRFALCGDLLGVATRLFCAVAEVQGEGVVPPSLGLTPTDAVVVSSALLRDQDMTPFDLTLWFQRVVSDARKSNSYPRPA